MPPRRRFHNPFRGVFDVMSEMSRMSERMTGQDGGAAIQQRRTYVDAWSPTTDILARGSDVLIQCELPGVGLDDVELTLSGTTLTISGERAEPSDEDDAYYVRERFRGHFRRDVTLPEGVGTEQIEARLDDGVLEVVVRDCAMARGPARIAVAGKRRGS